jgi:hypothetical protein
MLTEWLMTARRFGPLASKDGLRGSKRTLEHLRADIAEIKSALRRIAQRVDYMYGFIAGKWPELEAPAILKNDR